MDKAAIKAHVYKMPKSRPKKQGFAPKSDKKSAKKPFYAAAKAASGERRDAVPDGVDLERELPQGYLVAKLLVLRSGKCVAVVDALHVANKKQLEAMPEVQELDVEPSGKLALMDGDKVLVKICQSHPQLRRGRGLRAAKPLCRVIRLLERATRFVVAVMCGSAQRYHAECYQAGLPSFIELETIDAAVLPHIGQWLKVEILEWQNPTQPAYGRVVENLGWQKDAEADQSLIIAQYNLPGPFSDEVLAEAEAFSDSIDREQAKRRKDCSKELVITIDPKSAKDHDDALGLHKLADGWLLSVHIADVSHFVSPGSLLDEEALQRGNSTYLVDRVIPMLPQRLSNDLCSLREGVKRYSKLCEIEFDAQGRRRAYRLYDAVVQVQKRFSYEDAMAIIENRQPAQRPEHKQLLDDLHQLGQLLRTRRMHAGSLDLDFASLEFELDEQGQISSIHSKHSDASHQLVEECMLAANSAVAHALRQSSRPAIHRVHEDPDAARLKEFEMLAGDYGYDSGDLSVRANLQQLISNIKGSFEEQSLMLNLLKSLKRARYSAAADGHYGLAMHDYCHFTSPIRRYADLVVHRAIAKLLQNPCPSQSKYSPSMEQLAAIAEHISQQERRSSEAEFASKRGKLFAWLIAQCEAGKADKLAAVVVECMPLGVMVEVADLQLKGLVKVRDFPSGRWWFERSHQAWGNAANQHLRCGSRVFVTPQHIDFVKMQVDFAITGVPPQPEGTVGLPAEVRSKKYPAKTPAREFRRKNNSSRRRH